MKIILKEGEEAEQFLTSIIDRAAERIANRFDLQLQEIAQQTSTKKEKKWVTLAEAKEILGVRSKSKMQQIRDESPMNGIIISQHGRIFRYERASLLKYIQKHVIK